MPNFATYSLIPHCYRSDKNGAIGEDVSALILSGSVTVDADAEVPMTFTAQTTDPDAFPAFSWLAPFLTVSWWNPDDGDVSITEQVGLYQIMPPGETHTAVQGMGRIEGRDPCWLLKQWTTTSATNYAAGANVIASVVSALNARGFDRVNIPASSRTFTKKRAYDPGTDWLTIINDLLYRAAHYPLFFDRQGVPSSRPYRTLGKEEPARTISSRNGDVVNVVTLDTDPERLCNRVVVIRNDAAGDPIYLVRTNARADSPVSTVNLGITIGKTIEASNLETSAEAEALAMKTLEEGASVLTRLSVDTIPDPRFDVRDVVELSIVRDDGSAVADGKWRSDEVEIGFVPGQGAMRWRLNRLRPFAPEG
jgi:hypothetical protein